MLIMRRNEEELIDNMATRTDFTSAVNVHANDPGENLMMLGGATLPELPDPAIGGANGSRIRNGFSTGFRSFSQRFSPFLGAMAVAPTTTGNPVQGDVGKNNRATSLYLGVKNQLSDYSRSTLSTAAQAVGIDYGN